MRRTVLWLAVALWLLAPIANAEEPQVGARAAILMEAETGRVLFEKNADERLAIASTTKIMTALLAIENASMDEIVTAGRNASGVPGTSIYLSEGEQLSMEEMLYGLMLRSGNDAAVAIAEHIDGSVEAFAARMNARAEALGANAYFTTPNGLDSGGNGASARGLARIAREAMRHAEFRTIVSTKRRTIPWSDHEYMRVLTNKNKLLSTYDGAMGIKTGFTKKAGRCLVFAAERADMRVVGAVLRCPNWFEEAAEIMDFGFETYTMTELLPAGAILTKGREEFTLLSALRVPLREGELAEVEMEVSETEARAWAVVNGERLACAELSREQREEKLSFAEGFRRLWLKWSAFNK